MNLSTLISMHLSHKRALGHRFKSEDALLGSFCRAVGDATLASIEAEAVLAFLNSQGTVTAYWVKKYHVLSGLYRRGFVSKVPLPHRIPRLDAPAFVPYIYSQSELKRLLDAVPSACSGRVSIDDFVFRALLLLLYGAPIPPRARWNTLVVRYTSANATPMAPKRMPWSKPLRKICIFGCWLSFLACSEPVHDIASLWQ